MKQKWIVLLILAFIWVIFSIIYTVNYITVPSGSTYLFESIKFLFLSISAFGVLFSTLLSSFNSLESTSNIKDRIEFEKTENSFSYIFRWDSDILKEARDETRRIKKIEKDVSQNQLLEDISGNESLERSVITMFNYFEGIYLSIRENRVNAPLLKEAFKDAYIGIYERFKEWINQRSDLTQRTNLKKLYDDWR